MLDPSFIEHVGRFELHRTPNGSEVYFDPGPHAYFGEVKAKSEDDYSYVRESRFTGVSTPVKTLDSNVDPLLWWAAKLDQIGIASLASAELAAGGDLSWLGSQKSIAAALNEADLTWAQVRDHTATRGTNVHESIFLALATEKKPPSLARLSAVERGYGQAALRWWHERNPVPVAAEQVTIHTELRVAGRFDLLCDVAGERLLVDAKTREGGKARKTDHAQLAGYEMCNTSCGIGPSDRQLALILRPDGSYLESWSVAEQADFTSSLDAYRRGGALDKRMRDAEKAQLEMAA